MSKSSLITQLRLKAERELATNQQACNNSFSDVEDYFHELQVYHVELEMQAEELRRTQAELIDSRDKYLELYHNAPVGYISISLNGMILKVNDTFASMIGIDSTALVRQPLANYIAKESHSLFYTTCNKAINSEKLGSCELQLTTSDDKTFYGHLDFLAIVDDPFHGTHYRISVVDISERIQSEQDRLRLEREVLNTQKEESLRRLAGGIAHNFNNQLTGVIGNIELVKRIIDERQDCVEMLNEAFSASLKLADLSAMMLHYLGQTSGKKQVLEIISTTEKLIDIFRRTMHGALTIKLQTSKPVLHIEADPLHYAQIVNNIVANSVESLAERSGTILIRADNVIVEPDETLYSMKGTQVAPGEYVVLEVEDTGSGMDAEVIANSIEPFFTTKFTGRGLGLSAVLGIIHSYSGFLFIHSSPEKGTTVKVYFPCKRVHLPKPPARIVKEPTHLIKGSKILVIDDNYTIRCLFRQIVENVGCEVFEAASGSEAIEVFREVGDEIACVLLDFSMPDIEGNMVLDNIRALRPKIPVLLISGYPQEYLENQMIKEKPNLYIQKPCGREDIISNISKLIAETASS